MTDTIASVFDTLRHYGRAQFHNTFDPEIRVILPNDCVFSVKSLLRYGAVPSTGPRFVTAIFKCEGMSARVVRDAAIGYERGYREHLTKNGVIDEFRFLEKALREVEYARL